MPIRSPSSTRPRAAGLEGPAVMLVETPVGWIGLYRRTLHLSHVIQGQPSPVAVMQKLLASEPEAASAAAEDWNPALRQRVEGYFSGSAIDFADVEVELPESTEFQRNVLLATRRIPRGQTVSYGELARLAGRPGAARAAGQVMAANRLPLVIPCHRVLASGGRLGGYTAETGLSLKESLLRLEGAAYRR